MSKKDLYQASDLGNPTTIRQQWHAFYRLWRMSQKGNMWYAMNGLDWNVLCDFVPRLHSWRLVLEDACCSRHYFDGDVPQLIKLKIDMGRRTGDKEMYKSGKSQMRRFLDGQKRYRRHIRKIEVKKRLIRAIFGD